MTRINSVIRLEWTLLMVLCFLRDGWQVRVSMDEGGTSYHQCPRALGFWKGTVLGSLLFFIIPFCLFGRIIGFVPTGSPWASAQTGPPSVAHAILVTPILRERNIIPQGKIS